MRVSAYKVMCAVSTGRVTAITKTSGFEKPLFNSCAASCLGSDCRSAV